MLSTKRLSRDQRKARTRELLLEAAGRVFARRGYHASSLDEIAEEAGFTKGAVYSNFHNKEDLFFELLDLRHAEQLRRAQEVIVAGRAPEEQVREAARDFSRFLRLERDWFLLFVEFWAYAVRDPRLRRRFAGRVKENRDAVARIIGEQAAAMGIALPLAPERLATAVVALWNGFAIAKLADPDAVTDDLLGFALASLFGGLARG